jgi:hypothetical protein
MPIPQNEIVPVLFVYIYRHTVIGLGKRSPLKVLFVNSGLVQIRKEKLLLLGQTHRVG